VLVWDRHPIHKRKSVQNFIQPQKYLVVFEFPVAAPELNPAEFVWTQTVEYVAGTAPHDKYELQAIVFHKNACSLACTALNSTGSINGLTFFKN
jgi:hypothetical protein